MGYKQNSEKVFFDFYRWTRKVSGEKKRIKEFRKKPNIRPLTKEQEEKVRAFYKDYKIPDMIFHSYFTDRSGEFHENYIPQDIYVGYIDPYFNDVIAAKYFDNKCLYESLFYGIPQCETVLKRVNSIWLDADNAAADADATDVRLKDLSCGVFVKEAQTSSGGNGVIYFPKKELSAEKIMKAAARFKTDVIVQKELVQHKSMAQLNESSVNTLRIYSLLGKDGSAHIYSIVVRMGSDGGKLDNYSAGGMTCGITENGTLRKYGYDKYETFLPVMPCTFTTNILLFVKMT